MGTTDKDKRIKAGQKTLKKLMKVARKMFSERGYADTFTAEIVREAGVTRGALYYHFPQKKDIFVAVFEEALNELSDVVHYDYPGPVSKDHLIKNTEAFLRAGLDPLVQTIFFTDGPVVLGMHTWRRYDQEKLNRPLEENLQKMIDAKVIKDIPIKAISHILVGATNEAIRWIASSDNPERDIETAMTGLTLFIDSL